MGGFADFKRAKTGRQLGKIETHLAEKLAGAEWGSFELRELFNSYNGDFDIKKEHINGVGDFVITAGLTDNGVLGKTDISARIFPKQTITVDMFGCAFYRDFPYKMVTHARVFNLTPKFDISDNQGLFIANSLRFLQSLFGYENMCSWAKIKDLEISLPQSNGKIDFSFMENFIAELKALRVTELHAYLQATGLSNYTLTEEEKSVIEQFEHLTWKSYSIGSIFDIATGRDVIIGKVSTGSIPLISHQHENNGITKYIEQLKDRRVFDFSTTLSLADRGVFKAYSQNQNFHIGTRVKALTFKNGEQSENVRLFFVSAINRLQILFTEYSQNATDKLPELEISLPYSNENYDESYMDILISAVKKLVIKDVVDWADREIATTEQVAIA